MSIKPRTEFEELAGMCVTSKCSEPRLRDSDGTFLSDYCSHCVEQPLGLHLPMHDAKNREADEEADMMVRVNASKERTRQYDSRTGHQSEDNIDLIQENNAILEKIRSLAERCDISQLEKQARELNLFGKLVKSEGK